jgi:hypothetical protein
VITETAIISFLNVLAGEVRERREGVFRAVREHHQRPHEVVPRGQERERRERDQDRLDDRHHDRPVDAPLAGAVDARGVQQLVRDAERVLPHEEDSEHRGEVGHHHADVRVHEPHLASNRKSGSMATCEE